jgi:hypothetical protein
MALSKGYNARNNATKKSTYLLQIIFAITTTILFNYFWRDSALKDKMAIVNHSGELSMKIREDSRVLCDLIESPGIPKGPGFLFNLHAGA